MSKTQRTWALIGCLTLATIGYYLPWFTHSTAGFTTHAFDLAEWTSLHPAVRSSSPPMLTSFLLRVPHVVLAVAFALVANRLDDPRGRWLVRGMALLLALRMIPPTDFFDGATDDPNYRQMALLTVLGIVLSLGALPLSRAPQRWQDQALIALLLLGVVASWMGLSRARTLLDNFAMDVHTGIGIIALSVTSIIALVLVLWPATGIRRFLANRSTTTLRRTV